MSATDGGPAFPNKDHMGDGPEGLSIRDYMAAKALAGFYSERQTDVANIRVGGQTSNEASLQSQSYEIRQGHAPGKGEGMSPYKRTLLVAPETCPIIDRAIEEIRFAQTQVDRLPIDADSEGQINELDQTLPRLVLAFNEVRKHNRELRDALAESLEDGDAMKRQLNEMEKKSRMNLDPDAENYSRPAADTAVSQSICMMASFTGSSSASTPETF